MKKIIFLIFLYSQTLLANIDLLPVDKAFQLKTSIINNTIQLNWTIPKGYYLYKDKIKITTDYATTLDKAIFSKAKIKNDDLFGEVAVFYKNASIKVPVLNSKTKEFKLQVSYQGCADIGICYPPVKKVFNLTLDNWVPPKTAIDNAFNLFKKIGNQASNSATNFKDALFNQSADDLLSANDAFKLSVKKISDNKLLATWDIQSGYYLYNNKFFFDIKGADFKKINFPKGKIKDDAYFGKVEIHRDLLEVEIPLKNITKNVVFIAKFQGCADVGVCYPPQQQSFEFNFEKNSSKNTLITKQTSITPPQNTLNQNMELSEQDTIANLLKQNNLWLVLLSFFGFGLLLSFTPCVFPMIPILSSIIIGQGDRITTSRAFLMSLTFVLAMAITYASVGVLAGYLGANLQIIFQNKWVLIGFSTVFVILALSMFGLFEIQLPKSLQTKVTEVSGKQEGGSLWGVLIMGFLSALIVGPCVAPPLAGALIYIGQTGDAVLGGLSLFVMSLGMGAPLILIGTSAGKLLPKAGSWMDSVKAFFGIMMLAVAIYLLERIVGEFVSLILWATLATTSAVSIGALDSLTQGVSPWRRLFKALGLILLGYSLLLWLLVARGGGDMFKPLSGWSFQGQTSSNIAKVKWIKVKTNTELNNLISNNKNKLVVVDFYADWCIYCKTIDKEVFSQSDVLSALGNAVMVKIDITENTNDDKQLLQRFSIFAPPAFIFFKNGQEVKNARLVGEFDKNYFLTHLNKLH
ncbi:Cytochrome c-type biogenesis protein DsbD, protein-disulfide reductase [hydrothermal vent metagenome]|uniref:Thiol:disulfide interchange protein DsbD n=1 Tax=hydrothermal vent metagenome TaxID=652676 RepID=A0A1W1C462_9ZZZZ